MVWRERESALIFFLIPPLRGVIQIQGLLVNLKAMLWVSRSCHSSTSLEHCGLSIQNESAITCENG